MKSAFVDNRRRGRGAGHAVLLSTLATLVALAVPATARAADGGATAYGARADRAVMGRRLVAALAGVHAYIPAFSRQTHLACSVCHYQFPALTPFGRMFKLNGYTMTGLTAIVAPTDTSTNPNLKLLPFPPMAAMFIGSFARTNAAVPGTQNNTVQFPDQASVFIGGAISPTVGIFSQFTYAAADGSFGVDNIDLRYAAHHSIHGHDVLLGLTLNNNPTVEDVWNTLPAWGYPFIGSEVAPGPIASTALDGSMSQESVGLGAYTMVDDHLYADFSLYRSAPQGVALPLDATAQYTTRGTAPYWRLAWQQSMAHDYLMIGTYGLYAQMYPAGVTGPTDGYTDIGGDAQWEHPSGDGAIIGRISYTHESQRRIADVTAAPATATNLNDALSSFNANISLATSLTYGLTLGYFQTTGSSDALLYQPGAIYGSASGSPNTQGLIGEVSYNAWQNVRVGLQYVAYTKFNGSSSNYDGFGRSAADNNTLYGYVWLAF